MLQLYHGDCKKILPQLGLEQDSYAIVTDPPWGTDNNGDYSRFSSNQEWSHNYSRFHPVTGDKESFDPQFLLPMTSKIVLWGYNNFANKLPPGTLLVWIKFRPSNFDFMLSAGECGWMSQGRSVRALWLEWHGAMRATERGEPRIHPNQKPVELFKWCFTKLGVTKGSLIVDPYMGSGSCGIAALEMDLSFIGIDIDPEYFALAQNRIIGYQTKRKH